MGIGAFGCGARDVDGKGVAAELPPPNAARRGAGVVEAVVDCGGVMEESVVNMTRF